MGGGEWETKRRKSESGEKVVRKKASEDRIRDAKTTFRGTSIIRGTTIDEKSQTKLKDKSKSKKRLSNFAENNKQFR